MSGHTWPASLFYMATARLIVVECCDLKCVSPLALRLNETGSVRINVVLGRVRVTVVAVEKQ
jgi:hypothetical protein